MGYENTFSLKIIKTQKITTDIFICPNCQTENTKAKFCPECGTQMSKTYKEVEIDPYQIIAELREFGDDCSSVLDKDGSPYESFSGYNVEDEIQEFSSRYPDAVFQLDIKWDSGFGDPPSRFFFKNGKKQEAKVQIIKEDFDESKFE